MTTTKQKARAKIDAQLRDTGWTILDMAKVGFANALILLNEIGEIFGTAHC